MPDIFDARKQSPKKSHPAPVVSKEGLAPVAESTTQPMAKLENHTTPHQDAHAQHQKKRARHVDDYSSVMSEERPSSNPLDAFAAKPISIFFDSQIAGEQVLLLLRKSPVTQIKWVITALLLAVVPLLFTIVPLFGFLPLRFQVAALTLWYLLLLGYVLESFLSWFFNVFIITDERVIDVDFLSLIYKNISSAKIDNIEDITAETGGALRSIFNFGTVKIQTAGANTEIQFEDIPQPAKVTRLLNELLLEEEREKIEGRVN